MANHLTKDDINKLTSKIMYSYFEDGKKGCEKQIFYTYLKNKFKESDQNYGLHRISDKILEALCYIYNEKKKKLNEFDNEICWYFYYWLGDKIYPLVLETNVFSTIINKTIYKQLNDNNIVGFTVCPGHYNLIDLHRFKKYKLLFDYSKDYRYIEEHTSRGQTPCDNYYKNYINEYISVYKEAYLECKDENKKKKFYCRNFFTLFKENPNETLSSFSCTLSKNHETILEQPTAHETQEHVQNQDNVEITKAQDSVIHHNTVDGSTLGREPSSGIHQNIENMHPVSIENNAEGGHSKSITSSAVPLLGVPFISFLLYRFTPAGRFINKLLERNRDMYNPLEGIDGSNTYSEGMVDGHRRMNISYHRL